MDPFGADFVCKFGQLLDLNSTAEQSKYLNDLPDLPLLAIFELLNIKDVSSISQMNKRFFRLTKKIIKAKKRHLVISFGMDSNRLDDLLNRTRLVPSSSRQRRITTFDPIVVDNNDLLSAANRERLRPVESLVFYSNNFYNLSPTFNIGLLPNLKFLQSNDFDINSYIVNSSDRGLRLPNIEHLILGNCPFDVLCKSFPNVLYVELMQIGFSQYPALYFQTAFKPRWKSLVVTQERLNSLSSPFIKFLIENCSQLRYLQVGMEEQCRILHLNSILNELVQVNELKLFVYGSTYGLQAVLSKHLERLSNSNFKLSINFVTVQPNLENLEPIYEMNEKERYCESEIEQVKKDARLNFDRREFYGAVHTVLLDEADCSELAKFEEHRAILKRLDRLNVWKDRMDVDLGRFLRTVPDSIVTFTLRTLDPLPQYILDAIPTMFPYLCLFILNNLASSTPDLKFLRKLAYLSELKLKDLTFSYSNRDDLYAVIEGGRFFSCLTVEYLHKSPDIFNRQIKPQLLAIFEQKERTNQSRKFETDF